MALIGFIFCLIAGGFLFVAAIMVAWTSAIWSGQVEWAGPITFGLGGLVFLWAAFANAPFTLQLVMTAP
jgi:hypothetical protein